MGLKKVKAKINKQTIKVLLILLIYKVFKVVEYEGQVVKSMKLEITQR